MSRVFSTSTTQNITHEPTLKPPSFPTPHNEGPCLSTSLKWILKNNGDSFKGTFCENNLESILISRYVRKEKTTGVSFVVLIWYTEQTFCLDFAK